MRAARCLHTRCWPYLTAMSFRHRCELYGATATTASSPDGAAGAATHGVATSLLSPFGGGGMAGGGASRSSPGLFACPYCGSEEASFEGLQVRKRHGVSLISRAMPHQSRPLSLPLHRVTSRRQAAAKP